MNSTGASSLAEQMFVGYTFFAASLFPIVGILLRFHENPLDIPLAHRISRISPERYLQAGVHSFLFMIICGWILTVNYVPSSYFETNEIIKKVGFNQICVLFDIPPSVYIMPLYWTCVTFFMMLFSLTSFMRATSLNISTSCKVCTRISAISLSLGALFMFQTFTINPNVSMVGHASGFLVITIALNLVHICQYWQRETRSTIQLFTTACYVCLTILYVSAAVMSIYFGYVAWTPLEARFTDAMWMIFTVLMTLFVKSPQPSPICLRNSETESAILKSNITGRFAVALMIVLIPFSIMAFIWHAIKAVWMRITASISETTPDAISSDLKGSNRTEEGRNAYFSIPLHGVYTGDIFGLLMFFLTGQWLRLKKISTQLGPVFALNVGCPAVACMDRASAEVLLQDIRASSDARPDLVPMTIHESCNNINRGSQFAMKVRTLFMEIIPLNDTDIRYHKGIEKMIAEMKRWSIMKTQELSELYLKNALLRLIYSYMCGSMFDNEIDPELISISHPIMLPKHPRCPAWMLPSQHRMNVARIEVFKQMKASPGWSYIRARAEANFLSEADACENILTMITVNSAGLLPPMINAFCLVQNLHDRGQELLRSPELMDSFAWEILRLQGSPPILRKLEAETVIPTSTSEHGPFLVKSGTVLLTSLAAASRDPSVWSDPDTFKANRFVPLPSPTLANRTEDGTEPLPTLPFGCPLGQMPNAFEAANSHRCPFLPNAQPFIKTFLRIIIEDFIWTTEPKYPFAFSRANPEDAAEFRQDMSPEHLYKGIDVSVSCTPATVGSLHFSAFHARHRR